MVAEDSLRDCRHIHALLTLLVGLDCIHQHAAHCQQRNRYNDDSHHGLNHGKTAIFIFFHLSLLSHMLTPSPWAFNLLGRHVRHVSRTLLSHRHSSGHTVNRQISDTLGPHRFYFHGGCRCRPSRRKSHCFVSTRTFRTRRNGICHKVDLVLTVVTSRTPKGTGDLVIGKIKHYGLTASGRQGTHTRSTQNTLNLFCCGLDTIFFAQILPNLSRNRHHHSQNHDYDHHFDQGKSPLLITHTPSNLTPRQQAASSFLITRILSLPGLYSRNRT